MATHPIDCTLVTCELVPELDSDDRLLLRELKKRGLSVSIGVWSDPRVDWSASRLCVLRSTWDYHQRHRDFMTWIERVSSLTVLRNDPQLLRWNAHKSYLRELERFGVPIVPTEWLPQGDRATLEELRQKRGWPEIVLKPALGAAAHDVTHVRGDAASLAAGATRLNGLLVKTDVLVQPYLKAVVEYGERVDLPAGAVLARRRQETLRYGLDRRRRDLVDRSDRRRDRRRDPSHGGVAASAALRAHRSLTG